MGSLLSHLQHDRPISLGAILRGRAACMSCSNKEALVNVPERLLTEMAECPELARCFMCGGHVPPLPPGARVCTSDKPCCYRPYGCWVSLPPCRIMIHERDCVFHPIECKICDRELKLSTVKAHYATQHSDAALRSGCMVRRKFRNTSGLLLYKKGDYFWLWLNNTIAGVSCGVTYLGPPSNARRFKYKLILLSRDFQTRLTFANTVHSVLDREEDIQNKSRCFNRGEVTLDRYFNKHAWKVILAVTVVKAGNENEEGN